MIGGGGRVYWGSRTEEEATTAGGGGGGGGGGCNGVAVIFAWSSIVNDNQLRNYVDLYASLGWNSIVAHADFFTAFYPELATSLAFAVLDELVQELKIRPSPVIFVAFSGGPKACMYKAFHIIQVACDTHLHPDESQLVRNCLSGHVYDSGPLDFTSDLSAQFALHSSIWRMSGPSKLVSWVARGIASGLDSLNLTRFESQRAEYWKTLYSSVELGAPYLILCSENDDLAPYTVICRFAQRLQDLGGQVKVVTWNNSPHTGHYRHYPIQYRAAVSNFLEKAASVYSHKIRQLGEGAHMHDEISELICGLQKAAVNSNQSLRRVAVGPSDHFFLPSSTQYQSSSSESGALQDEQKERTFHLPQPPSINAHSVLGQFLFDACVPKNVEGWDIRFGGQPFAYARKHSHFRNMMKCNLRSRL